MADDKRGREKQARDADRRQHDRDIIAALERGDETEPSIESAALDPLEAALESLSVPATGADIVAAIGDRPIEAEDARVADRIPDAPVGFESTAAVRARLQRPTIATAMKQIAETSASLQGVEYGTSQREAYERTFRALQAIDEIDDDEPVQAVADWIVERLHQNEALPGSRAVRRQAASVCRERGYEISSDEWLGI